MPEKKSDSPPPPEIEEKLQHKEPAVIPDNLDDAVVVNVAGHGTKYKIPSPPRTCSFYKGSVRKQLVAALIVNLCLFIICMSYGTVACFHSLERADTTICGDETTRLAYQFSINIFHFSKLVTLVAESDKLYTGIKQASEGNARAVEDAVGDLFFTEDGVWDTSLDLNILTVFYPNLTEVETWYYPSTVPGKESERRGLKDTTNWREIVSTKRSTTPPVIDKRLIEHFGTNTTWAQIIPLGYGGDLFIYAFSPVTFLNGTGTEGGYIGIGRLLEGKLRTSAEGISACVTSYLTPNDEYLMDEEEKELFDRTPSRILSTAHPGKVETHFHETTLFDAEKNRFCPGNVALLKSDISVSCFVKFEDPSLKEVLSGPSGSGARYSFRIDFPEVIYDRGSGNTVLIVVLAIIFFGLFLTAFEEFITRTVLKRIKALSSIIKEQTKETEENRYYEITDSVDSDANEMSVLGRGKGGKETKKQGGSEASSTSSSRSTSSGSSSSGNFAQRNELTKLRSAMEENALALRDRMDKADQAVHAEKTRFIRNKQTLQLLNMWLGRQDFFPGLKVNALQLRYEPTRGIDDLLDSPLAVEYLKVHCAEEKTLENLLFLLDVAWLKEVEIAQANAETSVQREQLACVAENAAQTIIARYIAEGAPQPINISAETRAVFAEKDEHWHNIGMFDNAEREVRLMLDTDVLPRFRKTVAYTALSETLYFSRENGIGESSASAMSDETVSTFGSIDTDEGTEGEELGHNFAHAFTRLHIYNRDDTVTTAGTDSTGTSGSTTDDSSRADASTDTSSTGKGEADLETDTSTATDEKKESVSSIGDDEEKTEKDEEKDEEKEEEKKPEESKESTHEDEKKSKSSKDSTPEAEESKSSSESGSSKHSSSNSKKSEQEAEESGSESQKASSSDSSSESSSSSSTDEE